MQGRLTLAGDPVAAFDAATKQYVDRFTSMGVPTGAYIGAAPPGNVLGPLWWDSVSGQLFIQYNDGSSTQWVSANSIDASTLEGSFLPLTGGTMTGPLNYTATGGTVARSAQDRSADMANVLDYGGDPTGVLDSSTAINAAAAVVGPNGRNKTVYLPTGTYRVNRQILLTQSQGLVGDARGSSILYVDQAFSPTDTSVILVRAAFRDAGPVLRDFGITFAQPQDQTSRANFKTLAAGGTSGPGGTGVKYPWAIAAGDDSFRTQIMRVRIGGAWDGITSNGHNAVFWLDDIEMGALDCGVSLGEGASGGILDFCHSSGYHFWAFDISGALLNNVFYDGQTTALRVGRVDGLDIRDFSSFCGRLIVTAESAGNTSIHIANCMMDTDQATIEINGAMVHMHIANILGSANTNRPRPFISVNATCRLHISNYYSHSSSNFPEFLLTDYGADVTLDNFNAIFYPNDIRWAEVQRGVLRIVNGGLFLQGPRTVSAIAETVNGNLIIDNVAISATTQSGPLISVTSVGAWTMIGCLQLQAGHAWTFALPAELTQTFYSPAVTLSGAVAAGSLFSNSVVQSGKPGSPGTVAIGGAAGEQKALHFMRGANNGWSWMAQGATDDLNLARWNDSGVFQGNAVSIARSTGVLTFGGGVAFTGALGASVTDLSKHIQLYQGSDVGFSVTPSRINYVVSVNAVHAFVVGGNDQFSVSNLAIMMQQVRGMASYANDGAAATGGVAVGQLYRNGSAVMVRVA
jgi:hypothetical protein